MRRSRILAGSAAVIALCAIALPLAVRQSFLGLSRTTNGPPASFVGSSACRSCHPSETAAWLRSHHRAAMAPATDSTVLGRFSGFSGATIGTGTNATSFFQRDGRYFARTDGPDGTRADYEISYTFGVYPLQQYLVSLPGGRLQALTIAWDARPREQGGQRWFRLYPDSRSSADELHWTRPAHNWNYMCADCHSTGVRKNYDAATSTFRTTWSEISVGCEACHGPGSRHVTWANTPRHARARNDSTQGLTARLDERRAVSWIPEPATGNARRSRPRQSDRELQVCAQCHSRRSQLGDGYVAGNSFYDYYRPALLATPLYYADGQQRAEVYEWGSFLQSRMNARGVTCSDCHEPHSGELRARGAAVCAQCHSPARYDSPRHHHHAAAGERVTCLSCHMPSTTYMHVDARRDHSFRIPRPDLTVALGTPNACTSCHADRGARWAAAQIVAWRSGDTSALGFQRFARAFAATDARRADAQGLLRAIASDTTQPIIARATALGELRVRDDPAAVQILARGLNDAHPLVRLGALAGASTLPLDRRAPLVTPLLSDPLRAVRVEALRLRAGAPVQSSAQDDVVARAAREYVTVQQYNADRAEAHANLGTFYADQDSLARAESELRLAIRVDSFFPPAYANLADVLRSGRSARDADAEQVLRAGLSRAPADAGLHHSLGLTLIRLHRLDEARAELRRAAELDPLNTRFGYVWAVALASSGRVKDAITELERMLALDPDDRDVLAALAAYRRGQVR